MISMLCGKSSDEITSIDIAERRLIILRHGRLR